MPPPGKTRTHSSHERWLVSYADFITLLFAFFVVLFASSQIDRRKTGAVASSIQSAFAGTAHGSLAASPPAARSGESAPGLPEGTRALEQQLRTALASEMDREYVSLEAGRGELTLSLKEVGFFESGSAELQQSSANSIGRIARILQQYDNPVRVEGHTDNVPISTARFASNWELSTARAIAITRTLTVQFGIRASRLSVAGFAEHRPVRPNADSAGRAANRRVDIVIIGSVLPPDAR